MATHGFFLDIGVPDSFAQGQQTIPARHRRGAVFFDRDGVLIEDTGYPHDPAAVRWTAGASTSAYDIRV